MKWLRRLILGVGVTTLLAVLIVAVFIYWFVPRPEFQAWVSKKVAEAAGPGVTFDSISLRFWPAPGIRFHNVTLGGTITSEGEEESGKPGESVATIQSLSCTLWLRPLLRGKLVPSRVYIERPDLSVERTHDGHWILGGTLQKLLASRTARPRSAERTVPVSKSGAGLRLYISGGVINFEDRRVEGSPVSLQIRNFDADYVPAPNGGPGNLKLSIDGPGGGKIEVDATVDLFALGASLRDQRLEAEIRGAKLGSDSLLVYLLFGLPIRNPGGVFDIEGSVSFSPSEGVEGQATLDMPSGFVEGWGIRLTAPVRLAGTFNFKNGEFSMHQARLDGAGSSFDRLKAEKTAVVFDWLANNLRVSQFELDAYGGAWKGDGALSFAEILSFDLALRADRIRFREFVAALSGKEIEEGFETLSGQAKLRGERSGSDGWRDTIHGNGHVELTGGEIKSSSLIHSIFKGILDLIPGSSAYLRIDSLKSEPTKLEHLEASFNLHDARAFTEDLDFVTSDYHLYGKGELGFDGSIRFLTKVKLTTGSIAKVYSLAAIPFRGAGDSSFVPIPVSVSGSVEQPRFVPDVSGLSIAPVRALVDAAKQAVGVGKDAGRKLGQGVDWIFGSGGKDAPEGEGEASSAAEPPYSHPEDDERQ